MFACDLLESVMRMYLANAGADSSTGSGCPCEFCKVSVENKFKLGDTVEVIKNEELFKEIMKYDYEIPHNVKEILGKKLQIEEIFVDRELAIKYKNKTFIIKEKCVSKHESTPDNANQRPDSGNLNEKLAALYVAILVGNLNEVSTLINILGPNVKINNTYPLLLASACGHHPIIKYLLDRKADVSVKGSSGGSSLHCAAVRNDFETCSLLVNYGADVNSLNIHKMTPIISAASLGYTDIVKLLAGRKEANLSIQSVFGETALHSAIEHSHIDCVETLLDIGGRQIIVGKAQDSVFHKTVMQGDEKIVELFLTKFGSSIVNIKENDKNAPIHYAVLKNRVQCLKLLIKYKADVNIYNNMFYTPLHIAVKMKHLDCIKILVEHKVELEVNDKSGYTPLQLGIHLHNTEIRSKRILSDKEQNCRTTNTSPTADKLKDIIVYLVKAGARLDAKDKDGKLQAEDCLDDSLMKELTAIQTVKNKPKTAKISSINPKSIAVVKGVAEDMKELSEAVKEMRDEMMCKMCNERRRSIVFGCGHTACDICSNSLSKCRLCHLGISVKVKMID